MANRRYSTDQYNTITPQPKTSSHSETFNPNCALSQQSHANTTKKHFFFSTSNIRFWTTGRSGKKTSREKLSNSASDIVNHGDQLRYVKEERNTLRRRLNECSLRNSEHNLQMMRTSCINEQQQQQQQQRLRQPDIRDITTIQLRHMSEPNVNMINDRRAQERYLQYMSKRNDNVMYRKNGNINDDDDHDDNDNDKSEQNNSSKWEEWMRNQPISVLRLDRTERLVLKIGG